MAVIPNNFAQANLIFGGTQYPLGAQVTIGLDIIAGSATPTIAANALIDNYTTNLAPEICNECRLTGVLVKFGPEATGPSALVPASVSGSAGTGGVASNVAFLVHKVTTLGGRAGRGRFYLPGPREANVSESGAIDTGTVTGLQTALGAFLTQMVADGDGPVLLHGETSPLSVPTPITDFVIDARVATQRRRLRR